MNTLKSPYRRGAEDGRIVGLLCMAAFFGSVFSAKMALLSLVSMAAIIAVPIYVFVRMRRANITAMGMLTFSDMWMQGIVTFLSGALISSLVSYIYLKWIDPTYITDTLLELADTLSAPDMGGDPTGLFYAQNIRDIVESGAVPSTGNLVATMLWIMAASGSLLSMLYAGILKTIGVPNRNKTIYNQ